MKFKRCIRAFAKKVLGSTGVNAYFYLKKKYHKLLYKKLIKNGEEIKGFMSVDDVYNTFFEDVISGCGLDLRSNSHYLNGKNYVSDLESGKLEVILGALVENKYLILVGNTQFSLPKDAINTSCSLNKPISVYKNFYTNKTVVFGEEVCTKLYLKEISGFLDTSVSEQFDFDVDVVYTWVDGSDPAWKERKQRTLKGYLSEVASSDNESRYLSRDELRYSLRSVLMYATWVRNIYIVTDKQVPSWLKEHGKIKIIDHSEIFPDSSVLPVFNSHAIESCLHLIPGLSECFLYLNDDVLLGKSVQKSQFFTAFGKQSKFFYSNQTFIPYELSNDSLPVDIAAYNNADFLQKYYNFRPTKKFKHTPIALKKSVLLELEKNHSFIFDMNRKARLRSNTDYSIVSSLHHHYGLFIGKSIPAGIKYDYINLGSDVYKQKLHSTTLSLSKFRCSCFCVNDVESDNSCQETILRDFTEAMEGLYSHKTLFEND